MQIPKDKILELIRNRGDNDQADTATSELPETVDTDKDKDKGLLEKFGINPTDLLKSGGGLGGKLGL